MNPVKVIAVLCGIRDCLEPDEPDLIVNNLSEAVDFVGQQSLVQVR